MGLLDILHGMQNGPRGASPPSSGQGSVAQSWIGTGRNEEIDPGDLGRALGADTINALSQQTGMSQDDLLTGMSRQLPELVDKLTPDGRLPTDEETSRW